jgi:hypothetical protein
VHKALLEQYVRKEYVQGKANYQGNEIYTESVRKPLRPLRATALDVLDKFAKLLKAYPFVVPLKVVILERQQNRAEVHVHVKDKEQQNGIEEK